MWHFYYEIGMVWKQYVFGQKISRTEPNELESAPQVSLQELILSPAPCLHSPDNAPLLPHTAGEHFHLIEIGLFSPLIYIAGRKRQMCEY